MSDQNATVEAALHQLETEALNFAYRFINMSTVRMEYINLTQQYSQEIRAAYASGQLTAQQAAEAAHQMRNQVLEMSRAKSCDLGRALAQQMKAKGLDLDDLVEKYAQHKFKTPFSKLKNAHQTEVLLEIVDSAGRPNPKVNAKVARLGAVGRGLFLLSLGIAVYNVATAEDMAWQAGREASNLGGGFAGGAAGGALAGLWLGPVGVAIGAIVGGVIGSYMADEAYVVAVGSSDAFVKEFLSPYVGFMNRDEDGIAKALYDKCGINMDRVFAVFVELDNNYNSDADDVALIYLGLVKNRGGAVKHALRLHLPLRELLVKILTTGWVHRDTEGRVAWALKTGEFWSW